MYGIRRRSIELSASLNAAVWTRRWTVSCEIIILVKTLRCYRFIFSCAFYNEILKKIENLKVFNRFVSLQKLIKLYTFLQRSLPHCKNVYTSTSFCNEIKWLKTLEFLRCRKKMQFYWNFSTDEHCFYLLYFKFFSLIRVDFVSVDSLYA